jgi:hypothetical protein
MKSEASVPPGSPPDGQGTPLESKRDPTSQNIEAVLDFYTREEQKISRSQRILERISNFVGQPVFIGFILVFVAVWMVANVVLRRLGMAEWGRAAQIAHSRPGRRRLRRRGMETLRHVLARALKGRSFLSAGTCKGAMGIAGRCRDAMGVVMGGSSPAPHSPGYLRRRTRRPTLSPG